MPQRANYCVGVYKNQVLSLTRVKQVLQLRQNLKYLNEIDSKTKATLKKLQEEKSEKNEKSEKMKTVTMQFKKKETEEEMEARKKSFAYLQKQIDDEKFVKYEFIGMQEESSDLVYEKLVSKGKDKIVVKETKEFLEKSFPVQIK
jgi:hypothetical protein